MTITAVITIEGFNREAKMQVLKTCENYKPNVRILILN